MVLQLTVFFRFSFRWKIKCEIVEHARTIVMPQPSNSNIEIGHDARTAVAITMTMHEHWTRMALIPTGMSHASLSNFASGGLDSENDSQIVTWARPNIVTSIQLKWHKIKHDEWARERTRAEREEFIIKIKFINGQSTLFHEILWLHLLMQ